jgi:type III restriction enzyme
LKKHRDNEVAFLLAKLTLEKYFRQDNEQRTDRPSVHRFDADVKGWLFPPQLLLLVEFAHDAADRIYKAIVESAAGTPALKPILRSYDAVGSTRYVDFDTTKAVYTTAPEKCHISHVVADTGSREQKMAQVVEDMPEVVRYVKNQGLGFTIPYTLWVAAVNNHGGFGRWEFVEITDPLGHAAHRSRRRPCGWSRRVVTRLRIKEFHELDRVHHCSRGFGISERTCSAMTWSLLS